MSFSLLFQIAYSVSRPTNANDIELEAALQQLALYLGRNAVKANMALWHHGIAKRRHGVGGCHAKHLFNC